MKRSIVLFAILIVTSLCSACNRAGSPGGSGAATPILQVLPVSSAEGAPDREQLGDEEFKPAVTTSKTVNPMPLAAIPGPAVGLPVVSYLKGADGEVKLRLEGVVGLSRLREILEQGGDIKAAIIESGDLRILSVDGSQVKTASGNHRDVLKLQDVQQRLGVSFGEPFLAPHVPMPGVPAIVPPTPSLPGNGVTPVPLVHPLTGNPESSRSPQIGPIPSVNDPRSAGQSDSTTPSR